MKRQILRAFLACSLAVSVNFADETSSQSSESSFNGDSGGLNLDDIKTYELGAVEIVGSYEVDANPEKVSISAKDIAQSGAASVEQAIKRIPGVYFREASGSSGSSSVQIRGYGSRQIGTYIDGIPMMSIYNGGADFAQFATSGLGGIEVSKSFADPALGAGTLGGAVNMLSRVPEKALEFTLKTDYIGSEDRGKETRQSINIGTKQYGYYFMVDYSNIKRDTFGFSKAYKTGWDAQMGYAYNGHYELETLRLKLGWTYSENNEYSLNYLISKGSRGGFQDTDEEKIFDNDNHKDNEPPRSYSEYPTIDTQTIYLLGTTYFLPNFLLDSKLFYQNYGNEQDSIFTGLQGNVLNDIGSWGEGGSKYGSNRFDDEVYGMVLNFNYLFSEKAKLEFGLNAKYSEHNQIYPSNTVSGWDTNNKVCNSTTGCYGTSSRYSTSEIGEVASSIFTQYSQGFGKFRALLALSYDRVDTTKMRVQFWAIENPDGTKGAYRSFRGPVSGKFAWQGVLYYDFLQGHSLHINVGQKHRMPTLSERYNGGNKEFAPNPDLKPESAINYEFGYNLNLPSTAVSFAVFYNDLKNMFDSTGRFVTTDLLACPEFSIYDGQQSCAMIGNIPKGYSYGGEVSFEQGFFKDNALTIGGSYSYIEKYAKNQGKNETYASYAVDKITGYSNHIVQGKISIKPIQDLEITGFATYESAPYVARVGSLTQSSTSGTTYTYWYDHFKDNEFVNFDVMATYLVGKGLSVNFGVYNLTDRDNYYVEGGSGQFVGIGSSSYPIYRERPIYKNHLAGRRYVAGFEWRY